MRVHLKGDALCTLVLFLALFTVLYLHFGNTSTGSNQKRDNRTPLTGPAVVAGPRVRSVHTNEQWTLLENELEPKPDSMADYKFQPTVSAALTQSPFDFQQYLRHKDDRNYTLLVNQPNKCNKFPGGPFLLIAIKSVVEEFDRREIVRKTWGREGLVDGLRVRRLFLLGVPRNRTSISMWETLVHQESQTYKDILLWDFVDTFFNLTLKEVHFLSWAAKFCSEVKFIFKGDADVFVNVENIIHFLGAHPSTEDLFVGHIINNAKPIRSRKSKYYIPETMYGLGMYPAYAGGGGFVMSGTTMRKLSKACTQVELFPIDDVFLGMCLQRINLKPVLHEGFKTFGIAKPSAAPHLQTFDPCFYKDLMVVHSLKVAEIWLMWNLLHNQQLSCSRKLRVRRSFHWRRKKEAANQ
ncbi:UDP-GlcNAc:betaGal beta-1,3-N-acetylglucosaminyltransferase 9 [Ambystoma mexicanum]|uniref:UDP-GlcNAc:betaGal beta-1,3-N-acetylglucosaminyltransferase 9 n=1 Tax=Ambystoma mexicanum TaxID=8296 RepID=UPI0037E9C0E6